MRLYREKNKQVTLSVSHIFWDHGEEAKRKPLFVVNPPTKAFCGEIQGKTDLDHVVVKVLTVIPSRVANEYMYISSP